MAVAAPSIGFFEGSFERMLRFGIGAHGATWILGSVMLVGSCNRAQPVGDSAAKGAARAAPAVDEWFAERAETSGLEFVHFNGMSGELYYPEIMAPGVALIDYDNDGDLDVYLVQGQMLGAGKTLRDAVYSPRGPLKDHLFRND